MRKKTKMGLMALSFISLSVAAATSATFAYMLNQPSASVSHPSIVLRADSPNLTLTVTPDDPNNFTYTNSDGVATINETPYLTPCSSVFGRTFLYPENNANQTFVDITEEEGYYIRYNVAVHNAPEKEERYLSLTPTLTTPVGKEAIMPALRMAVVQMDSTFENEAEDGFKKTFGQNLNYIYVPYNTSGQIRGYSGTESANFGVEQELEDLVFPAGEGGTYYFSVAIWVEGYSFSWLDQCREDTFSANLTFEVN